MTRAATMGISLRLKTLLIVSVFLYMAISLLLFVLLESSLYDQGTLLLTLGLGVVLILGLRASKGRLFDQAAILAMFFIIYVFPRLLMYLFAPEAVLFPFGNNIDAKIIDRGLLYVLWGTMLFFLGMKAADLAFRPGRSVLASVSDEKVRPDIPRRAMGLFLLVVALQLFSTKILGLSPYGKMQAESNNTLVQLVRTLFELDSAFLFLFATLLIRKKPSKKTRNGALLTVFFVYVVVTVMAGSRSGVLRVLMALVTILIVFKGNFRLEISKIVGGFLVLGFLSLILFPLATVNRIKTSAMYREIPNASSFAEEETSGMKTGTGLVESALNRLGIIDYAILIVTQEGDARALRKYMNFLYVAKSIINLLAPGTPFPEAQILTSRTIDVIYRGVSEPTTYERYSSEFWTLWGLMFACFGWWGGLAALFLAGVILHSLYAWIVLAWTGRRQFYARLWFLSFVTFGFIANLGFDSAFTSLFFGLLQFLTYALCLYWFRVGFVRPAARS